MKPIIILLFVVFSLFAGASQNCTVSISPSDTVKICQGQSIELVANFIINQIDTNRNYAVVNPSILWSNGSTASSITVSLPGSYYVTINDTAKGCSATSSTVIVVVTPPSNISISGDSTVCRGGTIQFTTTGTGGTWSSSNISIVGTIDQNGLFTTSERAGTTKIMYIATNANGCSDTAFKWITILQKPNAGIISGDTIVCRGKTIHFTTTGRGGVWSSSNISAVGTINQNGVFTTGTNAGTTKISYIITNANGCSDTAYKWITILEKSNAGTITGNASVCRGSTIQFTTSGTGGTWSSSNISIVGTIDQNGLFTTSERAGTTKIMYIATNANGCNDTAFKWITILQKPNAGIISGDTIVCRGKTIHFTTTGRGGVWSSSNISAVGTINQNGVFTTGTNAGTTKISYINLNANGCSDTAYKWITILEKPNAGIITGSASVCRGGIIQFTTIGTGGTWSSSNISIVGTIDQNGLFTTSERAGTTKIMYIVTNANGCSDTAFKWITILQKPNAGIITGDTVVCRGKTIHFTTTGRGGVWSSSNISAVGTINQNGVFATGTTAGTTKISYIITNANGCSDTAYKWITIFEKPNAGTITGSASVCRGGTIQFTTIGTGGTWSSSNISIVGTIDQNGLFTTSERAGTTKIMYIVTNANGCSDTVSKWITITNCISKKSSLANTPQGLFETKQNDIVASISPNPTNSRFNLQLKGNSNKKMDINVTDMNGKILFHTLGTAGENIHFGQEFETGMYMVIIRQDKTVKTLKAIKVKQ